MNRFRIPPPTLQYLSLGFLLLCSLCNSQAFAVDGASPKVMVSGDSISAGFNHPSYRMPFYNSLLDQGCEVDMVGDQSLTSFNINNGTAGIDYPDLGGVAGFSAGEHWSNTTQPDDTDHQAFGGMRADQILNGDSFGGGTRILQPIGDYAASYVPDYVLLHLGTNDLNAKLNGGNPPTSDAAVTAWANQTRDDMTAIVAALQAQNAAVKILIGNFIPRGAEAGDDTLIGGVEKQDLEVEMGDAYRDALTAAINAMNDSNVQLVDVASGFNTITMTTDGVHPNRDGEIHIANAYVAKFNEMGGCDTNGGGTGGGGGGGDTLPEILSPAEPGPIEGSGVDITWARNGYPGITRWWVRAGRKSDGTEDTDNDDYYNSGNILNPDTTSWTVNNLPADGSTVYISLWYFINDIWYVADINAYTNNAGAGGGGGFNIPQITTPVEPGPIAGRGVDITWDTNGFPGISRWWVRAGRKSDGTEDTENGDYYNSGNILDPNTNSWTISNLPADGSTVYISLWYFKDNVWSVADVNAYTNSEGDGSGGSSVPEITSPAEPGPIEGRSVDISWNDNGLQGISRWWVRAGPNSDGSFDENADYYNSGNILNPATNSWTITNLPGSDTTVYISLWYFTNEQWFLADVNTYTNTGQGSSAQPQITSPVSPGSISGRSVVMTWERNGQPGVTRWWVRAGQNNDGSYDEVNDYYNSGNISNPDATSWTLTGLPSDNSTIYLSLWYFSGDTWKLADVNAYTNEDDGSIDTGGGGGNSNLPAITSPLPPATINGDSVTITWDRRGYPSIERWWVRAGTNRFGDHEGENDYYNSGNISDAATNSWTITNLPADGTTVYISLWFLVKGVWERAEVVPYVNLPANGGGNTSEPSLTSPLPPATITGTSVEITWNRNNFPGITRWWVRAGRNNDASYGGADDYYNSGNIFNNAKTSWRISGLPADGSMVYISLWYYSEGSWTLAQVEGFVNN